MGERVQTYVKGTVMKRKKTEEQHEHERTKIKNYILHITNRLRFSRMGLIFLRENEVSYLTKMLTDIKKYFKAHKLCYFYIFNKKNIKELKAILGIADRRLQIYLLWQKKSLIKFIEDREEVNSAECEFTFQEKLELIEVA